VTNVETATAGQPAGYIELLRANQGFRNLWLGQVVSELGDWLATVALLNLMIELTGRAQAVGWYFIIVHLPSVFLGSVSGVLVDRLDRKKLMIAMDLARAVIVLGYLWVARSDQIWLIYLIAALEVAMMSLFEPARTALVPNLCRPRELVAANALSSITWSSMATLGAAAGGLMAASLGRNFCYILDSLSFLISAYFIARLPRNAREQQREHQQPWNAIPSGIGAIRDGIRYIICSPRIAALMLAKAGWGFGGGILLLLSVFGEKIFPIMGSGAAGIGILYTMRGIGALLGPIVARRLVRERAQSMRMVLGAGFFLGGIAYITLGQAASLPFAACAVMVGHMGGSIIWVFSTILLQLDVPDAFRGRVFAIELALMTLGIGISNYAAGYGLDVLALNPRTVSTLIGAYFFIPGILWLAAQRLFRD
jgi:hypothetical protein